MPATAYDIHTFKNEVSPGIEEALFRETVRGGDSLVQFVPGRSAMLSTMRTALGV